MRLRVCWIGFLLLISGLAFGLVQIDRQARATLVGVNASFSNVDQAYRRLLWDVRYIASTRTEDDLHKFSTTGIAEILNLADINRLHRLQPWLVSPALRHEVKITLDDLQYYLGLAGLKTANSWFEPREVENAHQAERLAAQLESVLSEQLHRFQYTGDGCQLGYTDVKNDIGKIENHQSPKASLKCLVQASKSLLDQLKEPLFEYRKVTNRKHSADLWSPATIERLRGVDSKLERLKRSFQPWELQNRLESSFAALAGTSEGEQVARWFYGAMGFSTQGATVERRQRPNLDFGGLTFAIAPPDDVRILIPDRMAQKSDFKKHYLKALVHELGHAVYYPVVKQNLWAFRFPPDPSWYSEAMADLFVLMFLEPQTLAHCPNSRLSGYGQADVRQLRLAGPAAGALSSGLANAHYHMLVFGEPNKALPQVSADFLAQWPDHFFNRLGAAGAVPENLNLLYAVRELDGLIAYPLYNTGYVKGPLIIATLASRYFKTGGASWPELVGLSNDLRKIYAQGASRQADDLMLQLGVDVGDDDQLITGFERYFGLN